MKKLQLITITLIPLLMLSCTSSQWDFSSDYLKKLEQSTDLRSAFLIHFLIITLGEANHIVDFNVHTLRKGDVIAITEGQIHVFDESSAYKGYLVVSYHA